MSTSAPVSKSLSASAKDPEDDDALRVPTFPEDFHGTLASSVKYVPMWYQVMAIIFAFVAPLILNDFEVLSWATKQFHFDFGTSTLWTGVSGSTRGPLAANATNARNMTTNLSASSCEEAAGFEYLMLVNQLSIRERFGFAMYAVALLGLVFVTFLARKRPPSARCSNTLSKSSDHDELFPRISPRVGQFMLGLAVVEAFCVLRGIIAETLQSTHIDEALHLHKGRMSTLDLNQPLEAVIGGWTTTLVEAVSAGLTDSLATFLLATSSSLLSKLHLIVHCDILIRLSVWWIAHIAIPAFVVVVYRSIRYQGNKSVPSQRWLYLNFLVTRLLCELGLKFLVSVRRAAAHAPESIDSGIPDAVEQYFTSFSDFLAFAFFVGCCITFTGGINYYYGPSKRRGGVDVNTFAEAFSLTTHLLLRCATVSLMCVFGVLTAAVGVHIVELLLLWATVFIIVIWIPASIDSVSCEVFAFFSMLLAFLNTTVKQGKGELLFSRLDAVSIGILCFVTLTAISLVYNFVVSITVSRKVAALVLVGCVGSVGFFQTLMTFVVDAFLVFIDGSGVPHDESVSLLDNSASLWLFCGGVTMSVFLSAMSSWVRTRLPQFDKVNYVARIHMTIVTPPVLLRKLIRLNLLALQVFVAFFVVAEYVTHFLCSMASMPANVGHWIGVVCGCAFFGALTDSTAAQFQFILRVIGMLDPPQNREEDDE